MEKTKKDASGFVAGIKGKAENVLNGECQNLDAV